MNNRTHIINELEALAPGISQLPATMPYTLPQGYFDNFSSLMFEIVKGEEAFALLDSISAKMPYQVPTGYFDTFSDTVLQRVKNKEQQSVPQGYFESLPDVLLAKVRQLEITKELEEIAPILNTINKQPVQYVPAGYFENLQLFKVEQPAAQSTPVISLKKKTNWLKYAVAACIALLLSFGGYRYFSTKTPNAPVIANVQNVNVDKQLASLDDATIENYLQENESVTESSTNIFEDAQEDGIDNMLKEISEQQLKQHLEENTGLTASKTQKKI